MQLEPYDVKMDDRAEEEAETALLEAEGAGAAAEAEAQEEEDMRIKKAIKILQLEERGEFAGDICDINNALRLGIRALKERRRICHQNG